MKKSPKKVKINLVYRIKFFMFFLFAILAMILFIFASYLGYTPNSIYNLFQTNSYYSILVYILLIAIASATTLPISAVLIPGVILFGFFYTILFAIIGILFGALFTYSMTKHFGMDFVQEYSELRGGKIKILKKLIEEKSLKLILLFNFVYFIPSNLAHMVGGLTKIKLWKFLVITAFGNLPNSFAFCLITYGVYYASPINIISGLIILVLSAIIPIYFYREHLKEIVILVFSEKVYKKFKRAEKELEK